MNSAIAAGIGLCLSIILIIRKLSPFYSLLVGAMVGGMCAGWGLEGTVREMISGVKDIVPAIVRILAAGVLTGMLVKTGAAEKISVTIVDKLGAKHVYFALALSALLLTGMGVFIDVAVITIAPIALIAGGKLGLSRGKLLLAMIGGGKCGNIMSPNPNTIIAAENYGASIPSVMGVGIIPAVLGLLVTVLVIVPLLPDGERLQTTPGTGSSGDLPSFAASITGPAVSIILLALRPVCGISVDPLVALPAGGIVGIIATGWWRQLGECLNYGLGKMSSISVLLVGTGTLAGVIKASAIKDVLINLLSGWKNGALLMAPLSGALMSGASASTTAGATIASASFSGTILAAGLSAIWAAAMTNAGATVLDHLPHGSFFHSTGGSVGMSVKDRLKLIPYESLVGVVLTLLSVCCCLLFT